MTNSSFKTQNAFLQQISHHTILIHFPNMFNISKCIVCSKKSISCLYFIVTISRFWNTAEFIYIVKGKVEFASLTVFSQEMEREESESLTFGFGPVPEVCAHPFWLMFHHFLKTDSNKKKH